MKTKIKNKLKYYLLNCIYSCDVEVKETKDEFRHRFKFIPRKFNMIIVTILFIIVTSPYFIITSLIELWKGIFIESMKIQDWSSYNIYSDKDKLKKEEYYERF